MNIVWHLIKLPAAPMKRDLRFAPTRLVDEPFGSELTAEGLKAELLVDRSCRSKAEISAL